MSRKKKIIILLIVLLIVLPVLHYTMGIFTRHNYFTALFDKWNGDLKQVVYGEMDRNERLSYLWAERNGFQFKRIAGCDVTMPLVNGAEMYNNVMRSKLDEMLGHNWEQRMISEIDTLYHYMSSISTNGMTYEDAFQYQLEEGVKQSMIGAAKQHEKVKEMEKSLQHYIVPGTQEGIRLKNAIQFTVQKKNGEQAIYSVIAREYYFRMIPTENYIEFKIDSATREIILDSATREIISISK